MVSIFAPGPSPSGLATVHTVPRGMAALHWANLLFNTTASHVRLTWTISAIPDTLILFDLENYWRRMRPSSAWAHLKEATQRWNVWSQNSESTWPSPAVPFALQASTTLLRNLAFCAALGSCVDPREWSFPSNFLAPCRSPPGSQELQQEAQAPAQMFSSLTRMHPGWRCGHHRHRVWIDDPGALLLQAWGWPAPPGPSRQGALWRKVYTMSMTSLQLWAAF